MEKKEMLSALEICLELSRKLDSHFQHLHSIDESIRKFDDKICELENEVSSGRQKIRMLGYVVLIGIALILPLCEIMTYIYEFLNIPATKETVVILFFIIDGIIAYLIGKIIITRKTAKYTSEIQQVTKYKENMEKGRKDVNVEIDLLIKSPENELRKGILPPDYFETEAIEKFIFFLRNGHANNMQEAVIAYDNYRHNKQMEDYAFEATYNSMEAVQNTEKLQKSINELEFWTAYNTYLNSKR